MHAELHWSIPYNKKLRLQVYLVVSEIFAKKISFNFHLSIIIFEILKLYEHPQFSRFKLKNSYKWRKIDREKSQNILTDSYLH